VTIPCGDLFTRLQAHNPRWKYRHCRQLTVVGAARAGAGLRAGIGASRLEPVKKVVTQQRAALMITGSVGQSGGSSLKPSLGLACHWELSGDMSVSQKRKAFRWPSMPEESSPQEVEGIVPSTCRTNGASVARR
jgi:hypothetical protein